MLDLSLIIVSWNVRDLLRACLDCIQANVGHLNVETIVVDSASMDGTTEMVCTDYPWVKVLAQSENVGFVRGSNIGLGVAQGHYLMLLNPDTEVVSDVLPKMVAYLDEHSDVGIVGPHTVHPDGKSQRTSG